MAATEPIGIVELDVDDAQAGMALSTEAGWNQNEDDWRFFLSQGAVFGMRDGPRLVATAALLPYSAGQCLDQHGAGDRELPPPRHCDQARRRLPERGGTDGLSRPGWTRHPTAPPSTDRSASSRRCNCDGCG